MWNSNKSRIHRSVIGHGPYCVMLGISGLGVLREHLTDSIMIDNRWSENNREDAAELKLCPQQFCEYSLELDFLLIFVSLYYSDLEYLFLMLADHLNWLFCSCIDPYMYAYLYVNINTPFICFYISYVCNRITNQPL